MLCHLQSGGKVQCERLLWTPVLCLVIADGKCWEPEKIVMEKQDNSITFEIVTNECNTWLVSHCSTFVTQNLRIVSGWKRPLRSCSPSTNPALPVAAIQLFRPLRSHLNCWMLLLVPPVQMTSVTWWGSEGLTCSAAQGGSTRDLHRKTQKGVVGFRCSKVF